MKKVKTPIVIINGTEYTNSLKGVQIKAGTNLFSTTESALPNSSFNISIRRPYKKIHGYTDISDPNNLIVNGVLYNSSLNVVLTDVTVNHGSDFHIVNGGLYRQGSIVENEETGWTDLSNEGQDYGTFLGIKNGSLYMLNYSTKQTAPAYDITKDLYAWTYSYEDEEEQLRETTIYAENENINIGDTLYTVYLTELGIIETIEDGNIIYNENTYVRDIDKDTTGTKTIPATYETKVWTELIDASKTYTKVCGNCGHDSAGYTGTNGYAITSDNKFYKIDWKTHVISLVYSNITDLYKSPKIKQSFLIKASNGTVRHIKLGSGQSDSSFSQKIDSDVQFITPGGYWGAAYNTNVITIKDGNLYNDWTTQVNGNGHWTQISTGYECGYGICDGKLYKLYGTNSSWYNKQIEEIKLIDSTNVWVDLYCGYSDCYGLTKDGKLYYIKDEKLTLRRINIPMGINYDTYFTPQTAIIPVGESDQTRQIAISKSLLDTLVADAEP